MKSGRMAVGDEVVESASSQQLITEEENEYVCRTHNMVRNATRLAVHNYFTAPGARMSLCVDFHEGAVVPCGSSPYGECRIPIVQIKIASDTRAEDDFNIDRSPIQPDSSPDLAARPQQDLQEPKKAPVSKEAAVNSSILEWMERLEYSTVADEKDIQPPKPAEPTHEVEKKAEPKVPSPPKHEGSAKQQKNEELKRPDWNANLDVPAAEGATSESDAAISTSDADAFTLRGEGSPPVRVPGASVQHVHTETAIEIANVGTATEDDPMRQWHPPHGLIECEGNEDSPRLLDKGVQCRGGLSRHL